MAALLAFAMLLAAPAQAQAQTTRTLVSNESLACFCGVNTDVAATSFTTGDNAAGYTLSAIRLAPSNTSSASARSGTYATVKHDNAGRPGTLLAELADSPDDVSIQFGVPPSFHSYAAPADITLEPNTTYWVVVNEEHASQNDRMTWGKHETDTEDSTGLSGWSIGDNRLKKTGSSWSNATTETDSLLFSVQGHANPNYPKLSISDASAAEGSAVEFTVTLSQSLSDDVTVEYATSNGSATGGSDYTSASAQSVTISSGQTSATISIATIDDSIEEEAETFTVTLSSPSANAVLGSPASATGTILASDIIPDLDIAPASAVEGSSVEFTVTLSPAAADDVTVDYETSIAAADTASATDFTAVSSTTLTIAAGETSGTISIATTQDSVDEATPETFTLTLSNPSTNAELGTMSAALGTIYDDDASALSLSVSSIDITEGETVDYTVALATAPSEAVTVSIDAGASSGIIASPSRLSFTSSDWNQAQTVSLTASQDDDASGGNPTLTHSASGGNYRSVSADIDVTLSDNDVPDITLSVSSLSVPEDTSATWTVQLATKPTGKVTLDLAGHAGTDLTVTPTRLEFEPDVWDQPLTVTVSAAADSDSDDDQVALTYTASGGDYAGVTAKLDVLVTEMAPTPAILLSETLLHVLEADATTKLPVSSYTVVLGSAPTGDVTVAIARRAAGGGINRLRVGVGSTVPTGSGGRSASLTFTTDNWDEPQQISVRSNNDESADHEEHYSLKHSASGGGYDDALDVTLPVFVEDDDIAYGYKFSTATVTIDEGASGDYRVRLKRRPTGNVEVAIAGGGDNLATSPTSLTFTPDTWYQAQTVTVTAADPVTGTSGTFALTHTGTGGGYDSVDPGRKTVQVNRSIPSIQEVTVTSTPLHGSDTYAQGERIAIAVTFTADIALDTTGGAPTLQVNFDSSNPVVERAFAYVDMTGSRTLNFEHTVVASDRDDDGLAVPDNALVLNGATIKGVSDQREADIGGTRLTARSGHKVRGDQTLAAALLGSLQLSYGGSEVALTPVFAGSTRAYTATITGSLDKATVTATGADGGTASIMPADASNDAGHQVALGADETEITVKAARPPRPESTYTLMVTRESSTVSIASVDSRVPFVLEDVGFTVTRTPVGAAPLEVAVTLTQSQEFLTASRLSQTVTIPANQASATLTLGLDDFRPGVDADGTLTATIASGVGYDSGSNDSSTVNMVAANPALDITLDRSSYGFLENAGTVTLNVVAETAAGVPEPTNMADLRLIVISNAGSATRALDYNFPQQQLVHFAASDFAASGDRYVATKALDLELIDDTDVEGDEDFEVLVFGSAPGVAVCTNGCTATVTIADDESPPSQVMGVTATPGQGSLTVRWSAVAGAGGYKVQWKSGAESFADAATDARQATVSSGSTVSHVIPALTDGTSYTVRVIATRSGSSDGTPSDEVSATPGLPTITIEDASATEGAAVEFAVKLDRAASGAVTVEYATTDGTATSDTMHADGADFTPPASGASLTIGAGQTSGTISIVTGDDVVDEEDETFTVTLSNPTSNAVLGTATATGTIVNDDSVRATITGVAFTNAPSGGDYGVGDVVEVSLTFDQAVGVTGSPRLALQLDGTASANSYASYSASASTDTVLVFRRPVTASDDDDTDGVTVAANALELNGGGIFNKDTTVAANIGHVAATGGSIHTRVISSIAVTSSPSVGTPAGYYGAGEVVEFTVTFSEAVSVDTSSGTPALKFSASDGALQEAAYASGSGGTTLKFSWTVQTDVPGTESAISVPSNAGSDGTMLTDRGLILRGGSISDSTNGAVNLRHGKFTTGVQADTTAPVLVSDASGAVVNGAALVLTFERASGVAEHLDPGSVPDSGDFVVVLVGGRVATVSAVEIDGAILTLTLDSALGHAYGGTKVSYTPGTNPIQDLWGNETGHINFRAVRNDSPEPVLSVRNLTVSENAGSAVFEVSLDVASGEALTVDYATANGTAVAGSDYTGVSGTLSIGADTASKTVSVAITDDTLIESAETFTLTLSNAVNARIGVATATATITDDDTPTLTVSDASATEGSPIEFTVALNPPASSEVTVQYATTGVTATAETDYTPPASNAELTIAAGQTSATISIATLADSTDEDDETFTLTLSSPSSNAVLGTKATATGTITDDETPPSLELTVDKVAGDDTVNIAEKASGFAISGGTGTVTGAGVEVEIGGTTLTATSADVSGAARWSVRVPADASYVTGASVTVTVSAQKSGYTSADVTRTVVVDLSGPTAPTYVAPAALQVGEAMAALSPTDGADIAGYEASGLPAGLAIAASTGVVSGTPTAASASASEAVVTVLDAAGNPAAVDITFPAVAKGEQDLSGFAYSASTVTLGASAPTVTAPSGAETVVSYSVPASASGVCSVAASTGVLTLVGVGSCPVTASAAASADWNAAASAPYTVTVEAASTTVSLGLAPTTVAEDAGATVVTVTASLDAGVRDAATPVTVSVGSDTATSGTDFTAVDDFTLTIPAGSVSHTGTFTLTPSDDAVDEGDETVSVTGATTVTGLGVTGATLTIGEDDVRGVTPSVATLGVPEGSSATYTLVLASEPTGDVTVTPSAQSNADLSVAPATVTFTPSNWNMARTVTVSAKHDPDGDADSGRVTHAVSGGDYGSVTVAAVEVTVDDDETASTAVALSVEPTSVDEDAGATVVTVTGTLDHAPRASATSVTVAVGSASDTATEGTDYATVGALTLTIAAGAPTGEATFTLTPTDDAVYEGAETIAVSGREDDLTVTGTTLGLADDETPPSLELTVDKVAGDDTVNIAEKASGFAISGGTGTVTGAGVEVEIGGTTLTATSADVSGAARWSVRVPADASYVTGASVTVTVSAQKSGYTSADVTRTVVVDLSGPTAPTYVAPAALQVGEAMAALSPTDGADIAGYEASGLPAGLAIAASTGVVSGTPTAASASASEAVVTVLDAAGNPAAVDITFPAVAKGEQDLSGFAYSASTVTLGASAPTVTAPSGAETVVSYSVPASASGVCSVAASTGVLTLVGVGSCPVTASAAASADWNAAASAPYTVTVEAASTTVSLGLAPTTVAEDAGATVVTVTASLDAGVRDAATPVTVSVGSDTATSGTDFTAVDDFTLTIPAGSVSHTGTFTLTPSDDAVDEGDETVSVTGATTVTGLGVTGATLTIGEDDVRGVTPSVATLGVPEGSSATYTLVLASEPTGDVTVTPSAQSNADLSVAPATVTFTPSNWNMARTVTVSAKHDPDGDADSGRVTHAVSGGDYGSVTVAAVEVTVDDDETASTAVALSVEPTSVDEDAGATVVTVTGTLDHAPRASATSVTVAVGSASDTATEGTDYATVGALTLTIAAGAPTGEATFTLTPTDDAVYEGAETIAVSGREDDLTVTGTTLGLADDETPPSLELTVDKVAGDDTVNIAEKASGFAISGGTGTVTGAGVEVEIGGTTLTATSADVSGAARWSVRVPADASYVTGASVTVTVSAQKSGYTSADVTRTVVVDLSGPTAPTYVAPAALQVGEAMAALSPTDGADIAGYEASGLPAGLAIAASTGVVSGTPTAASASASEAVVTVLDAAGNPAAVDITFPAVAKGEQDLSGFAYSASTVTLGASAPTVTAPSGAETVVSYSVPASASGVCSVAASTGVLTLVGVGSCPVTASAAASADWNAAASAPYTVTVEAASTTVSLGLAPTTVAEDAGATVVTVTASLDAGVRDAATPVTVSVGSDTATSGTDFTAVDDFTLTIPAGSVSHTGTFTLTPSDDAVDEGDETVSVTGATTVTGLGVTGATLTIGEDDVRGVTPSVATLGVPEGSSATYTLVLASEPTGDVTVTPSAQSNADLSVAPATVTFTPSNWNMARTVTVSAKHDPDGDADSGRVTHAVSGGDYGSVTVAAVEVTVDDDETASTAVALSVEPTSVDEDAGATVVTVTGTLDHAPRASATSVTVAVGSASDTATEGTDYATVGALTLTIAAGAPTGEATFTLTPTDDAVYEGAETIAVSGREDDLTVTGTTLGLADDETPPSLELTVDKVAGDDTVNIAEKASGFAISGGTGTVTGAGVEVEIGGTTLTATSADVSGAARWSVRVPADASYVTGASVTVTVSAQKSGYTSADVTRTVVVDLSGPTAPTYVAPAALQVGEAMAALSPTDGADIAGYEASGLPAGLAIAASTGVVSGTPTAASASASEAVVTVLDAAGNPAAVDITFPAVAKGEQDLSGFAYSASTVTLGASAPTVTAPSGAETVVSYSVPASASGVCSVAASTGVLTLVGVGSCPVTASAAASADWNAAASAPYTVTVEAASTTVSLGLAPTTVAEDAGATVVTVTASLDAGVRDAATPVTVSVGSDTATSGTDFTAVDDFTLTIPAGSVSHTGTFTLTPSDDAVDEGDETVSVTGATTVTGLGVTGATLTIGEDDVRGVTPSVATLGVPEGSSATYTLVLASEPTGDVTVTPSAQSNADLSVAPATVTFTPSNWNMARTVTVSAKHDPDGDADSGRVTHAVSGGDYGSVTVAAVEVTVDDDETASTAVALSVEPTSVDEDAGATVVTVTGTLDHAPRASATSVTVAVGSASDTATEGTDYATVGALTLTIAAGAPTGEATFTLTPTDDAVYEGAETIAVSGREDDLTVTGTTLGLADDETPPSLELTVDKVAGDDTVNIAEKASGFAISGGTGTVTGAGVEVEIGGTTLTATSADVSGAARWSVRVPADASYVTGASVTVTVSAQKSGYTSADVTRTVVVDLSGPTAPTYVAPAALQVGEAMAALSPTDGADIAGYEASGLPAGLAIAASTGVVSGTPTAASASASEAVVTVLDAAGNPAAVDITFPAVAKGEQDLSGFAYSASTVTLGASAPTVTAPSGAETVVSYSVPASASGVCSVAASTGVLTLVGVGSCPVTASAAASADWNAAASAPYTVTVEAAVDPDTPPKIVADGVAIISQAGADSEYVAGDDIKIRLRFSRAVTVAGTPQIELQLNETRKASYVASESTTTDLVFSYEVGAGDYDHDGIGVVASSLALNAGSITGTSNGKNAELSHDALTNRSAHKVHVAPLVAGTSVASTPTSGRSYATGETIRFAVTFDRDVRFVTDGGMPTFRFYLHAGLTANATYSGMSGDRTALFDYAVTTGDYAPLGPMATSSALSLNGGMITRREVNDAIAAEVDRESYSTVALSSQAGHAINAARPVIVAGGVSLSSIPAAGVGTYGAGETIEASVRFSKAVYVDTGGGTPRLRFSLRSAGSGSVSKPFLDYADGSGTDTLVFRYTVLSGDADDDGITINVNSLKLRRGTIRDADGTNASLAHGSLRNVSDHKVDGSLTPPDDARVLIGADSLAIDEGDSGRYHIRLGTRPTGTVTVTPAVSDNVDVTVSPATLTFTTDDWNDVKTVTVSAAQDDDPENDTATVTHAVSGADYASVEADDVPVTVNDDEIVSTTVSLSTTPSVVAEDAAATTVTVTGTLNNSSHATDTVLTVSVGASGDAAAEGTDYATVNDLTLTIPAGQTSGTATFTLTPTPDDVAEADEMLTMSGMTATVGLTVMGTMLTIVDDDERGLAIGSSSLAVDEGESRSYTVALRSEPTAMVTVTIAGTAATELELDRTNLTFTPSNWDEAQTVEVTAGHDADSTNDTAALTHVASGGGYGSERMDLSVTVLDDEPASPNPGRVVIDSVAATAGRVTLRWTAPPGAVLGYRIEASYDGGAVWAEVEGDTGSADTVYVHRSGLNTGETRHYRVSAIGANGASPPSAAVAAEVTTEATGLTAIGLSPRDTAQGGTAIDVCWKPDGVQASALRDIGMKMIAVDPSSPIDWDSTHWQPMGTGSSDVECVDGLGYRVLSVIGNQRYALRMRARNGGSWVVSNDAYAVSVDLSRPHRTVVRAGDSGLSGDTPVPDPVCRDFDDPATTADEQGSFFVTIGFTTRRDGILHYEPVQGFDPGDDVILANATAYLVDRPYDRMLGYRVRVTPTTWGQPVTVSVPAAAVTHAVTAAGNLASAEFRRDTSDATDCDSSSPEVEVRSRVTTAQVLDDDDGNGEWTTGERIRVTLEFDERITVTTTNGIPGVTLKLGDRETEARASFSGVSGAYRLVLEHVVTTAQSPLRKVALVADSLSTNGGEIRSLNGPTVALDHPGVTKVTRPAAEGPLTASWPVVPNAHSGAGSTITLRLQFSEAIVTGFRVLRDEAFSVTGGAVTGARRVDGRSDLWEIRVEPSGSGPVTVHLPATTGACNGTGAICAAGGLKLSAAASAEIAGPTVTPLTTSFENVPTEHDGSGTFTLKLAFSEEPERVGFRTVRDSLFTVSGGRIERAKRTEQGSEQGFELTIEPSGNAAVTLALATPLPACGQPGAVCASGGRSLTGPVTATIQGPPSLAVQDAEADEGLNASLAFTVELSRAASGTVTVDYATSDVTAVAGDDYTAASGTLSFAAGETSKTVSVPVLDDAHDDDGETLTLTLSNPSGAWLSDATATGTITNSDPLQKMWLSRFGRTVALQTIQALEGRFAIGSDASPRMTMTVAGQSMDLSRIGDDKALAETMTGLARTFGAPGAPGAPVANDDDRFARHGIGGSWNEAVALAPAQPVTGRDLLLGSSFHFTTGEASGLGGAMTGWGKVLSGGSSSSFGGGLSFTSETATGVLGMDWERDRLLVGVALSRSVEKGSAAFDQTGLQYDIEGSLSMVTPYMRVQAGERLSFWSAVGSGSGSMSLSQGDGWQTADIAVQLAAVGGRAELLRPGADGGLALALKTDAFFVRSESARVSTPGVGNLGAATGDASRVRAVMEGSRAFALAGGGALAPSLSLGLRHDGGDAETGSGVEVGAGLTWSAPAAGLTSELRLYGLAAHEAGGYDEWGASGSLRMVPGPSGRGLSLSMTPSWGARDQAGRLWDAAPGGLAGDGGSEQPGIRLDTELGYGLSLSDGLTGTPYAGFGFGEAGARDYRLGWRLASDRLRSFSLGIEATRRENANGSEGAGKPGHSVTLRGALRW